LLDFVVVVWRRANFVGKIIEEENIVFIFFFVFFVFFFSAESDDDGQSAAATLQSDGNRGHGRVNLFRQLRKVKERGDRASVERLRPNHLSRAFARIHAIFFTRWREKNSSVLSDRGVRDGWRQTGGGDANGVRVGDDSHDEFDPRRFTDDG
jgi:hypothetical protein